MSNEATPAVTAGQPELPGAQKPVSAPRQNYRERLYLSWWGWPLPLLGATLLAAEAHMGYPGIRAWLPYLIMVPLALTVLLALGRVKVEVIHQANNLDDSDGELRVGIAHIPLRHIGAVEIIDRDHKRKALGPGLDPAAFVCHRGWIGPVLRVEVTDPHDPTPYWIFSTRKPEQLAKALRSGRE